MIWDRIPRTKYCSFRQLEFGVYDAVANFNIGRKATVLTYEHLHMLPGVFLLEGCNKLNRKWLYLAEYKNSSPAKKRRKVIRGSKKQRLDKDSENEGKLYELPLGFFFSTIVLSFLIFFWFSNFNLCFLSFWFCNLPRRYWTSVSWYLGILNQWMKFDEIFRKCSLLQMMCYKIS